MLLQILPYAFGAAVSPLLLVTTILVLSQPRRPRQQGLAYSVGALATISVIGVLLFFVIHVKAQSGESSITADLAHIVAGLLLLVLAARAWHKGNKANKPAKVSPHANYAKAFLLGVLLMASNFTTILMFIPAGVELQVADNAIRATGLIMMILFAMLPIWVPLFLVSALGKRGQVILDDLSKFMARHGHEVTGGFIGLIGLYVLMRGILSL